MQSVCIGCRRVYNVEDSAAWPYNFEFCSPACQEAAVRAELAAEEDPCKSS